MNIQRRLERLEDHFQYQPLKPKTVEEMSDQELLEIIEGGLSLRHLTDAELERIVEGGKQYDR